MIKLLPFVLIIVLILGGLGYWRYISLKSNANQLESAQQTQTDGPIEVPKTLPQASLDDRVKSLEDLVSKLVTQVNSLKSTTQTSSNSTTDSTINSLNTAITSLTVRVSALEKATVPNSVASVGQSAVYIPLGSGGYWENTDWYATPEYQISLNPSNYPGYKSMTLEVTFRVVDSSDVGSVRLYDTSSSSAVSGQVDTSSSSFVLLSTSSFKLASSTDSYKLQVKSTNGKGLFIQTARIKVTF